jgi:acetyl-CoA C-acetyltransferase
VNNRAVIVEAVRTPIGRFQGGLASVPAPRLGAVVIKELIKRTGLKAVELDEVIMGNVVQAGLGQNPARQAAIYGEVPSSVSAMTVNKVCGSGLKSVVLAAQAIKAGDASCIIAGGMENMNRIPYALFGARDGMRLGHGELTDLMIHDGLWDVYNNFHMGMTAELVVEKYKVSRQQQDEFAVASHQKAVAAWEQGKFAGEVVPVSVPQRKGEPVVIARDEGPRADASLASLAKLKPAFKRDGGSVTAGNASTINDGAAALLVCSEEFARAHDLDVRATIQGYATGALDPQWVMMAPVGAVQNLLKKTGKPLQDYGLFELNEAFAAQSVAVINELKLPPERVNVHGGGIALGHPIGCSGARILVTLLHAMEDRDVKHGIAALCLGGGDAVALAISRA